MDLYRQEILDHYKHPHHFGRLERPDATMTLFNSACGDKITMEVGLTHEGTEDIVTDIAFHGEGCAISIASASMLTDAVEGKSVESIMALTKDAVMEHFGNDLTPSRVKCALLPLEALQKCVSVKRRMI